MVLISWLVYGPLATYLSRKRFQSRPEGILLTFDDGPDPRYTPQLLDLLDEFQVKAVFFCLGRKVRRHPEIAHDILKRGHQVALHGASHLNAWWATPKQVKRNFIIGQRQMSRVGLNPKLYRPPYGRTNLLDDSTTLKTYWTKLFHDWDIKSQDKMLRQMKQASRPGEIFLLHDGTEGRAKTDMPLEMMKVLKQWLVWTQQEKIAICDGGRWSNEKT